MKQFQQQIQTQILWKQQMAISIKLMQPLITYIITLKTDLHV